MNTRYAASVCRMLVSILAAACFLPATESKPNESDKVIIPADDSMVGKEPGQVRDDNGVRMKLVWCPPGLFKMHKAWGSAENDGRGEANGEDAGEAVLKTVQTYQPNATRVTFVKVALKRGYWLGKYEVTQSEWKQIMATEPWKDQDLTKEADDCPATFVSWDDAVEFCRKLTDLERKAGRLPDGWQYTLPTEAQWDRACRATTTSIFSFGNDGSKLGEFAWFDENAKDAGEGYAHRVGQKKPNRWGLHDMHGNVMEWCRDMLAVDLPGGPDPEVIKGGIFSYRVSQGGFWGGEAWRCLATTHTGSAASSRCSEIGFRVALSPIPKDGDTAVRADDK